MYTVGLLECVEEIERLQEDNEVLNIYRVEDAKMIKRLRAENERMLEALAEIRYRRVARFSRTARMMKKIACAAMPTEFPEEKR